LQYEHTTVTALAEWSSTGAPQLGQSVWKKASVMAV